MQRSEDRDCKPSGPNDNIEGAVGVLDGSLQPISNIAVTQMEQERRSSVWLI
jgi:hypothetical protein